MSTGDARLIRFLQHENVRLKDESQLLTDEIRALRQYIRALQRLQETVQHFTPEHEILALLDETLECALVLLDATDGSLALVDEETDELVFVLVYGTVRETLPGYRFDRKLGIAGWVAEHASPVFVRDVCADRRFLPEVDEHFDFVTHSLVAVPLAARGKVLGVIEVVNKRSGENFTEDDATLLSVLATLAASALDYAASAPAEAGEQ
ncbi:MAG: GAF domain-containing protein [Chloroflexota bacterium]|nr:GAF domain-containing protein [Chloroflexota bacterium]